MGCSATGIGLNSRYLAHSGKHGTKILKKLHRLVWISSDIAHAHGAHISACINIKQCEMVELTLKIVLECSSYTIKTSVFSSPSSPLLSSNCEAPDGIKTPSHPTTYVCESIFCGFRHDNLCILDI